MADIEETLQERGSRYGAFIGHATITQALKSVARGTLDADLANPAYMADFEKAQAQLRKKWATLRPDVREAIDMVFHKIGRVLNGDPEYPDNFVDMAGYSKLVADRQLAEQTPPVEAAPQRGRRKS